jgi:hypothetical protein
MSRLTLFTDNFTRTNENPLSDSGAWVPFQEVGSNIAQLQVVSNSCESTTVSVRNANVVTGISFPSNQWAELTASSITGGPTLACRLRATSGNPGTAYDGNFSVSNFIIQRESGTTFTTLVTQAGTFTTGDVLRFEAIGTQLTLYKNNVSVATVSDATLSSGTAGIKINPGTPITTAVFSLFTAGSFVYAISGSAGVAGATVAYSGTASGSVVADGSGNYSITGLANGSYTLTPSLTGYTFSPVSSAQTVSNADITGVNFVATPLAPAGPPTGITITMLDGTTVVLSGKSYWTATQFVQSLRKQGGVWSIPPDPAAPATWYPYKNWKKVVTS